MLVGRRGTRTRGCDGVVTLTHGGCGQTAAAFLPFLPRLDSGADLLSVQRAARTFNHLPGQTLYLITR